MRPAGALALRRGRHAASADLARGPALVADGASGLAVHLRRVCKARLGQEPRMPTWPRRLGMHAWAARRKQCTVDALRPAQRDGAAQQDARHAAAATLDCPRWLARVSASGARARASCVASRASDRSGQLRFAAHQRLRARADGRRVRCCREHHPERAAVAQVEPPQEAHCPHTACGLAALRQRAGVRSNCPQPAPTTSLF